MIQPIAESTAELIEITFPEVQVFGFRMTFQPEIWRIDAERRLVEKIGHMPCGSRPSGSVRRSQYWHIVRQCWPASDRSMSLFNIVTQ